MKANKQWLGISFNQHKVICESNEPFEVLIAIDHAQQLYPAQFNLFQDAELYSVEEIEFIDETDYYLVHHHLNYHIKEDIWGKMNKDVGRVNLDRSYYPRTLKPKSQQKVSHYVPEYSDFENIQRRYERYQSV